MESVKKGFPFFAAILIALLAGLFLLNHLIDGTIASLKEDRYEETSRTLKRQVSGLISQKSKNTLLIALALSENPNIRRWIQMKLSNQVSLNSFIQRIKTATDYELIWIQLVDRNGLSMYRSWTDKRGDSLLSKRHDVVKMIENPQIMNTISTGIFTMTFKALVPIFSEEGRFLGSVEVITHFDSIAAGMRQYDVDSIILVDRSYRAQMNSPLTETFVQDYYVVNKDFDPEKLKLLNRLDLPEILSARSHFIYEDYLISIEYLPDIKGNPMGYVLIFKSISDIDFTNIDSFRNTVRISLPLGILFIFSLLVILLILRQIYQIRTLNKNLEIQVKERTKELETLNRELEKRVTHEIEKRIKQEQHLIEQDKLVSMSQMLSNISHQWRQPLNTIAILIQDMEDAFESGEVTNEYLNRAVQNTMRQIQFMSSTIDRFSNYFQSSGETTVYSIMEVLDFAASFLDAELTDSGIQLELTKEEVLIRGDPKHMKQVLLNLLNNSIDAIHRNGTIKGKIQIRCFRKDHAILIELEDNGGGIPDDILEKIFEPYFTTRFKARGVGLGLYMSRLIVENKMCGKLTVRNGSEGAIFTLSIPPDCL